MTRSEGEPSTEKTDKEFRRLKAIFEENGDELRKQFILAGLLLTIFERLKEYVISQVDGFFSNHLEVSDGDIKITRGEEFKRLIKEHGKGKRGEHSNEVFRAAMSWFGKFNAIEDWELKEIERLYKLRNEIGHELFRILADDHKKPIAILDVMLTFAVYVKIVRWWVREVELSTDPDMTEEKWNAIDFDGIESTDTIMLREIMHKSLEGMTDWVEMQNWVSKHMAEQAAQSSEAESAP